LHQEFEFFAKAPSHRFSSWTLCEKIRTNIPSAWKTWLGLTTGTSNFEWMDLTRRSSRALHRTPRRSTPVPGSTCPVCFCEPDEWHITSSCSHAVCMDCLRAYASSQIHDPLYNGPLKCPVCPQPLPKQDVDIALQDRTDLIEKWDEKLTNQLLRALPSYRPCPKCSTTSSSSLGGGFVTSQCLESRNEERRQKASTLLEYGDYALVSCFSIALLVDVWISRYPSPSPVVDLYCMVLPFLTLERNVNYVRRKAAEHARQALFQSITVECPCCDNPFILPAASTADDIVDPDSKQWMDRYTRRCPSCSVPITKNGGCNHMTCQNCKASFCWACMRVGTSCRAFDCHNGAQYGNASFNRSAEGDARGPRDSLLNRIDRMLTTTTGPPIRQNGIILLGILLRSSRLIQQPEWSIIILLGTTVASVIPVEWMMMILAAVFASVIVILVTFLAGLTSGICSSIIVVVVPTWYVQRRWQEETQNHETRWRRRDRVVADGEVQ